MLHFQCKVYSTDNTNFSQCALLDHTSQLLIISSKLNGRWLINTTVVSELEVGTQRE